MKIQIAIAAAAILAMFAALLSGCKSSPAWDTVDTFVNVTAGPYYEQKVQTDSSLSFDEREARLWELDAMRRMVEEIKGTAEAAND